MNKKERKVLLKKANEITMPHGFRAEYLTDGNVSVGVGGDERTYTQVIVLVKMQDECPNYDILDEIQKTICNNLNINKVTFELVV